MIPVDRGRIEPSHQVLDTASALEREVKAMISDDRGAWLQHGVSRSKHWTRLNRAVRPLLGELFENKCAFCETRLSAKEGGTARFRPMQFAANLDGKLLRSTTGG